MTAPNDTFIDDCLFHKERFLPKFNKVESGCWEWQHYKNDGGYGVFSLNGKRVTAHRASYRIFVGPISKGMGILHKCDNPPCVNPDHLYQGTKAENTRDTIERGQYHRWFGESAPMAKLTLKDVVRLREEHASKLFSIRELCERFGIGKSQIWNIVSGKRWKDFTDTRIRNLGGQKDAI